MSTPHVVAVKIKQHFGTVNIEYATQFIIATILITILRLSICTLQNKHDFSRCSLHLGFIHGKCE